MSDEPLFSLPYDQLLGLTAERTAYAGAGTVLALTCASAAALTAMAARFAGTLGEPVLAEVEEMTPELATLADLDAEAFGELLAALALPAADPSRKTRVAAGMLRACEVPLRVGELGARIVDHAALLVVEGKAALRGDAQTAAVLADACVRSAACLVRLNASDATDPTPIRDADRFARQTAQVISRLEARSP